MAKIVHLPHGFNVSEEINRGLLVIVLDSAAHVSDAVLKQLKFMSEFAVKDFPLLWQ